MKLPCNFCCAIKKKYLENCWAIEYLNDFYLVLGFFSIPVGNGYTRISMFFFAYLVNSLEVQYLNNCTTILNARVVISEP